MDIIDNLLACAFLCAIFYAIFYLFTIPIRIGESRGLSRRDMRLIHIFNWCGIFTGVLWFIALVLALTDEKEPEEDEKELEE